MMQIIDEIKNNGIDESHIIYINFEDYDYSDYTDPKKIHAYVKSKIIDKEKYYLFFDEIQNVSEFEKVFNSFRATLNVSIFITGSNSKILSSELSTHLSGRYISIKILPFTFSEYLELNDDKKSIDDKFLDYVDWGGMPQTYNTDSIQEKNVFKRFI